MKIICNCSHVQFSLRSTIIKRKSLEAGLSIKAIDFSIFAAPACGFCTELFVGGGVPMSTATETEGVGCSSSLTVIDVFNALQASYAFISGTIK